MENKRILFTQTDGTVAVIVPAHGVNFEQVLKAVPLGVHYEVVNDTDVPSDRTFRNAWFHDVSAAAQKVGVDLSKAKNIAHEKRRAKRAEELAPYDEIIAKKIPVKGFDEAEIARALIREKHATIQSFIDAAESVITVREIIDSEGL